MNKLNKKNSLIFAIILFVAGIISLLFYKTNSRLGSLSCLFLGGSFALFGICVNKRYKNNLIKLDKKLSKMIKDVIQNGQKSKYIGLIDENKKTLILADFIKKNKNKHILFYTCGALLLIAGIINLF